MFKAELASKDSGSWRKATRDKALKMVENLEERGLLKRLLLSLLERRMLLRRRDCRRRRMLWPYLLRRILQHVEFRLRMF
jgi:hypothetical protein